MHAAGKATTPMPNQDTSEAPSPSSSASQADLEALERLLRQIEALPASVFDPLSTKVDDLKRSAQQIAVSFGLWTLRVGVIGSALVIALVLLLTGAAGGLGILLGGRMWLGRVIVGAVVSTVLAGVIYRMWFKCSQTS